MFLEYGVGVKNSVLDNINRELQTKQLDISGETTFIGNLV